MLLVFTLVLFNSLPLYMALPQTATGNIPKPNCQTECGSLTVAYPFGIGGPGCSKDPTFDLICNSTYDPPRLFINASADLIQIHNISDVLHEMLVTSYVARACDNPLTEPFNKSLNLETTPFSFSNKNKLTVIGCSHVAVMGSLSNRFATGCFGICNKTSDVLDGECNGIGCGQASITGGLKDYEPGIMGGENLTRPFNPCGFTFLVDEESFRFGGIQDVSNFSKYYTNDPIIPTRLEWVINNQNCIEGNNECKGNSSCGDIEDIRGYRCTCNQWRNQGRVRGVT